jgi:Uri superfamily endonuclease
MFKIKDIAVIRYFKENTKMECNQCKYHYISASGGLRCRQSCIRRKEDNPERQHWNKDYFTKKENLNG